MSRPESPLKGNLSDEETIKKLKALLIKEKKINKENNKFINDLKADNEKKTFENNLLIAQIQRLSENIGVLDDSATINMKELSDLQMLINELKRQNESLQTKEENREDIENYFKNDVSKFMINLKCNLNALIKENCDVFSNKEDIIDVDNMDCLKEYILDLIENIKNGLQSRKEVHQVLLDGIEKITMKCTHMEKVIAIKDEKISALCECQKQLQSASSELDQREEQIKRLEELIEDNRNISRALETERDQLQNDLVDLRQRHEEKEGYLIEEFREAQQSLENYRIFTDKQSAEKANEMERLRKCLNDYQQEVPREPFMTECRLCRDVDSVFDKLRTDFDISCKTTNYDDVAVAVLEKYGIINDLLNDNVEKLKANEFKCYQELEVVIEKVNKIEQILAEKKIKDVQNYEEMFDNLNERLLVKEEKLYSLEKDLEQSLAITREIESIFDIDNSSSLTDCINRVISLNKELTNEISLCKNNIEEQKNRYEQMIREKDCITNQLADKLTEAGKQVNHNDLMNLEMAEIDKTLVNLNNQLLVKSAKITELELTIKSKEEQLNKLTSEMQQVTKQSQQFEERVNKMKQMLVKTKRELADSKSQCLVLHEKENLHVTELELLNVQLEDTKVLLGESMNEKEKLQDRYNVFSKKMDSITKNREITINSLRSQTDDTLQKYRTLQKEFDQYKIKVQTAFNTKLRTSSVFSDFMTLPANEQSNDDDVTVKNFRKHISDLEMTIDDLKLDLREKEEKIFSLQSEMDMVQWDNDKLSEKNKCVTKENNELTIKMHQINEQLQNDTKLQQISHSDALIRLNTEKEKLSALHQKQIESIRSIYELEIENLTQKLEEKEIEKVKLLEEMWTCREQLKSADYKLVQLKNGASNDTIMSDTWTQQRKSPLTQERQQGEGMEMINETENSVSHDRNKILSPKLINNKSAIYNTNFVPLDQLLNSHNDEQKWSDEFIHNLKTESLSYKRKNEHLTELLNDNEATVARLTEQALLLKAEIRRLENNLERDSNLEDKASKEYLKNVIVKFLHYDTKTDERSQLVPVLVTLLSLDTTEKELLGKFCKMCSYNKKEGDGWSSYFSWTGMS